MLYTSRDYRTYLKQTLASRITANPQYSLRAFARQLGLHHTMLVGVFKHTKSLSRERAAEIASKLGLTNDEHEYFLLLVELEGTKNPEVKSRILKRLSSFRPKDSAIHDLTVDHFKVISDWYHFPINQMVGESAFSLEPKAIADKLGIHPYEAEAALDRLERLELIEKDSEGNYRRVTEHVFFRSPDTNDALRRFHQMMLEKAAKSLELQKPSERIIQSQTLTVDRRSLKEIDRVTDEYFERVVQLSNAGERRDQIYHLSTVFFNLTPSKGDSIKEMKK